MSIPYEKIEELIQDAKLGGEDCDDDSWIRVMDVKNMLQKLIDDDLAALDELAQEFIATVNWTK